VVSRYHILVVLAVLVGGALVAGAGAAAFTAGQPTYVVHVTGADHGDVPNDSVATPDDLSPRVRDAFLQAVDAGGNVAYGHSPADETVEYVRHDGTVYRVRYGHAEGPVGPPPFATFLGVTGVVVLLGGAVGAGLASRGD
jgi:hypothetical protein